MASLAGWPGEYDVTSTPTDLDEYEYAEVGEDMDGEFYCIASTVGNWLGNWVCPDNEKMRPVPAPFGTRPVPGPPPSQSVPPVKRRIRRPF